MAKGSFGSRRRELEEAFFGERDQQLLQALRAELETKEKKNALAEASGIIDHDVLEQLMQLELCGETVAALTLVPLIVVAWADSKLDDKERQAIVSAAEQEGLKAGHAGQQMLERWLSKKPEPRLLAVWKDYMAGCVESLDDHAKEVLKNDLLGRARAVAEAAGGLLGFGNKVSKAEQAALDDLASVFD